MKIRRIEKIIIICSLIVLVISSLHTGWLFYSANSQTIPSEGGTYTEGVIGKVNFINPLLAQANSLDADITALVYSGLTKYDPTGEKIIPDLATFTLDKTRKKYTFVLRDNILWHDGEKVTADDVIFTYKDLLQDPQFTDPVLKASFKDVLIEKTDEKTVTFTLKEPYYFFPNATTIGILPRHIWQDTPADSLEQSEFNLNPVGSGPYKFLRLKNSGGNGGETLDLESFDQYYDTKPKIGIISLQIFQDESVMVSSLGFIDAANHISSPALTSFQQNERFKTFSYSLPQYVALFLNNSSKKLEDKKTRLGLLLATNKDEIIKTLGNTQRVDTPFLELKNASWIYQYDLQKAKGALYDAGWKMKPNGNTNTGAPAVNGNSNNTNATPANGNTNAKVSYLPAYLAATEPPQSAYRISEPNNGISFTTRENYFVIRGTNPKDATGILINNYALKKFSAEKGTWSYIASTELGTLKKGANTFNISYVSAGGKKVFLDSITITYNPAGSEVKPAVNVNANIVAVPANTNSTVIPTNKNTNISIAVNLNLNVNTSVIVAPANTNRNFTANANLNLNQNSTANTNGSNGNQNGPAANQNLNSAQPANSNTNSAQNTNQNASPASRIPAGVLPQLRYNAAGEPLVLRLVTTKSPSEFTTVAEYLKKEWLPLGVYLDIETLDEDQIVERLQSKDYDIMLYGQSLGYNLDTFPYWHSSQTGKNGFNLSNFKSFQADTLLEEIRNPYTNKSINPDDAAAVEKTRQQSLQKLATIFEDNNPAIFLYQPIYYYAVDTRKVKNLEVKGLASFSDRFTLLRNWYITEKQILTSPFSLDFFKDWVGKNL